MYSEDKKGYLVSSSEEDNEQRTLRAIPAPKNILYCSHGHLHAPSPIPMDIICLFHLRRRLV